MHSPHGIILAAINAKWIHPSLALRLLKANLGSLEDRCRIMEFALRQPLEEKTGPITAARPRILGLSVSIWNHEATLELLKALEKLWGVTPVNPDLDGGIPAGGGFRPEHPQKPLVVLGGPEVSWLPEDAEIFRYAGYVIRGEGELAFRKLCGAILEEPAGSPLPAKFIRGVPADPGAIDPGYRLYSGEDVQKKLVYVESSRGCPFGCEFCLSSRDRAVRYFPLAPFLAHLDTLINKGARTLKFLDRTFNLDMDRAERILEFLLDRLERAGARNPDAAGKSRLFCAHFEMVPSRFPPVLKGLLRRFPPGTLRLETGIQTLNPQTARLIHRQMEDSSIELDNLKFLRRETSAIIHADLIAGLPGESAGSFGEGFDRVWQALSGETPEAGVYQGGTEPPFEIQLGILKCLPGAPIARHSQAYGMRYSPAPPYSVLETAALPAAGLEKIKNFARFWELAVNRNAFPDLIPRLLPPGEPVFGRFMELSGKLLENFGRNWGIDRKELRSFLERECQGSR